MICHKCGATSQTFNVNVSGEVTEWCKTCFLSSIRRGKTFIKPQEHPLEKLLEDQLGECAICLEDLDIKNAWLHYEDGEKHAICKTCR